MGEFEAGGKKYKVQKFTRKDGYEALYIEKDSHSYMFIDKEAVPKLLEEINQLFPTKPLLWKRKGEK